MPKRKEKEMRLAGIFGVVVLVMIIALFIVGLSMIPDIILMVQSLLSTDEFGAEMVTFGLLIVGITVFSWFGYMKYEDAK